MIRLAPLVPATYKEREQAFVDFVLARHQVYLNRAKGQSWPWTDDPILQKYRFCNVYRELDVVTKWIRQNWSEQHGGDPDLWFAMVIARLINHPETLATINPLPWRHAQFIIAVRKRVDAGQKAFSSAYIVSTNGRAMPKEEYLAEHVLGPMWRLRDAFRPKLTDTLDSFHKGLTYGQGMGSFMAAQVVADVKNTRHPNNPLSSAPDWYTWAAPGPGSERGLARIVNGTHEKKVRKMEFLSWLHGLQAAVNLMAHNHGFPALCAQDVQNCLCEFDKYERVRLGQGTPRQLYTP